MPYLPIQDYGVIGDMRTVALVGKNGSIDWYCHPRFDSPSVFAAILDERRGGSFRIAPEVDDSQTKQLYWPDTNVLMTRFLATDGVCELTDTMPVGPSRRRQASPWILRRLSVVRGELPIRLDCRPAFDYGRRPHEVHVNDDGACFVSGPQRLALASSIPLRREANGVTASFRLKAGETATFVLRDAPEDGCPTALDEERSYRLFHETVAYWHHWIASSRYEGRWREHVNRSALALKLLTYEPTGAIVAAPTTSLPEQIGGERNWDYRFTWVRDAAFTLYALLRIGFTEEAANFIGFLQQRIHEAGKEGTLRTLYAIDGTHDTPESELSNLEGYCGSKPVRIGNAAQEQVQHDIYGELLDSIYLFNKHAEPIPHGLWQSLRCLVDWVADHWEEPDSGIWEVRSKPRHFVYSKVMCWVAMDRALRLSQKRSFPADHARWLEVRDRIYEQVMERGWNADRGSFGEAYGSDRLDAATLVLPLVFFVAPSDPRMIGTLEAIARSPAEGGLLSSGLVHRYDTRFTEDGLKGTEGTFNMCTFWLVEAMARSARTSPRRLSDARLLFEKMLGYANHLGLYSEETGPHGEALGNFPQGLTHLALISAAFNLDRALGAHD